MATPKLSDQAKIKRRVSLGVAVNAETGEVIEQKKRHSQRRHTMLNTSETINRVKDAEEKKACLYSSVICNYTHISCLVCIAEENKDSNESIHPR